MPWTEKMCDKKNKIAIVGVSGNPEKWGHKIFVKLKSLGFSVYPINPKHKHIEGNPCYPSLKHLPEKPDIVILSLIHI